VIAGERLTNLGGTTMRAIRRFTLFAGLLVACAQLAAQTTLPPGLERYSPTRVEWLQVLVNSNVRHPYTLQEPYDLSVVASGPNTLTIVVRYTANVNREAMNITLDAVRQVIATEAKGYGWSKWLQVAERIDMVNPSK
jgi:hypothetical protein